MTQTRRSFERSQGHVTHTGMDTHMYSETHVPDTLRTSKKLLALMLSRVITSQQKFPWPSSAQESSRIFALLHETTRKDWRSLMCYLAQHPHPFPGKAATHWCALGQDLSQLKPAVATEVPASNRFLYFAYHVNSTQVRLKYEKELGRKKWLYKSAKK